MAVMATESLISDTPLKLFCGLYFLALYCVKLASANSRGTLFERINDSSVCAEPNIRS
jgi:hypothetical protein